MSPTLPTYTAPLRLTAESVEDAYIGMDNPGWQTLDARNEITWHAITNVLECEDDSCTVSDIPGVVCIVLASDAWSAGSAHLESDARLTVRIPADEVAA